MNTNRVNRLGALSGLLSGTALLLGMIYTDLAPSSPTTTSATIVKAFADNQRDLLIGSYLIMIGAFFLIWFAAFLWHYLKNLSEETWWINTVILAGGISAASVLLVTAHFTQAFTVVQNYYGDDSVAKALYILDYNWYLLFEAPALAAFSLSTTISSSVSKAFPPWVNWLGLGISLLLLSPVLPGSGVMLSFLWIGLLSIFVAKRNWRSE